MVYGVISVIEKTGSLRLFLSIVNKSMTHLVLFMVACNMTFCSLYIVWKFHFIHLLCASDADVFVWKVLRYLSFLFTLIFICCDSYYEDMTINALFWKLTLYLWYNDKKDKKLVYHFLGLPSPPPHNFLTSPCISSIQPMRSSHTTATSVILLLLLQLK